MSQSAGEIYFDVELEVAQLINKSRQVNKELDAIGDAAKGASTGFGNLETQVKSSAAAVNQATGGLRNLRMVFGQLGYQIQDVAVQLQMGQNAMIVFAQQGSQIASIFGPGGAIAGAVIAISGALAGALLPSIFNSTDATDTLEKAQKTLGETVTTTSDNVVILSEKLVDLAKVSSDAAQAKIATGLADAANQMKQSVNVVNQSVSSIVNLTPTTTASFKAISDAGIDASKALSSGDVYQNVADQLRALGNSSDEAANKYASLLGGISQASQDVADKFSISNTQAMGLLKVFAQFQQSPTTQNMQLLATATSSLAVQLNGGNERMVVFNQAVQSANQAMIMGASATDELKRAQENLTGAVSEASAEIEGQTKKLTQLVEATRNEAATVGKSAREKAKYVATLLGAGDAEQKAIDASYDKIEAYEAEQKALKEQQQEQKKAEAEASAAAKRDAAAKQQVVNQIDQLVGRYQVVVLEQQGMRKEAAMLTAEQQLGSAATQQQIAQARDLAGRMYDVAEATKTAAQAEQGRRFATQEIAAVQVMPDAVTGAVQNPTAQIDLQEQQKLAALAKYQELDKQNTQIYEDAKTAIQQQAANARQQIIQNELNVQSQAISSILGSVSQGFDGLANLAAGAAGESSGAYKAMFALSKGFAVAQAALNLQLAISQAMADPTALTPAQKFANYAAIASAGASLLSSIGSIAYSGGRKNGGPVSAGSMYQVGESGLPEIYQASTGKQYMIPGDNGKVISNRELQGGGGGSGAVSISQSFVIHTTNGVDEATQKQIGQVAYTQALRAIKDQKRPGGMLTK